MSWSGAVIAPVAYDTAWLALVRDPATGAPAFPDAVPWLLRAQRADGSWGSDAFCAQDRAVCTLAAAAALAGMPRTPGAAGAAARGARALWALGPALEAGDFELVGAELLLPALAARARAAGLAVPEMPPALAELGRRKLALIPPAFLYSPATTLAHSLEFLGPGVDPASLALALGPNGSAGHSPAATAFCHLVTGDPRALAYLRGAARQGEAGGVPVLWPADTFQALWGAYHLLLAGVPGSRLLPPALRRHLLRGLAGDGVALSRGFGIPDADDTAVALVLLAEAGMPVSPRALSAFARPGGGFASFPHERHGSVGVNLHVLHALLRVPGYPGAPEAVPALLRHLEGHQRPDGSFLDKWHLSPVYATAHAACVLGLVRGEDAPAAARMREAAFAALCAARRPDGTWGGFGASSPEETAYAALALAPAGPGIPGDGGTAWGPAARLLGGADARLQPALWVDKCLYAPAGVLRGVLCAGALAVRRAASGEPAPC